MSKKRLFVIALVSFIFFLYASSAIVQDVFFHVTDRLDTFTETYPVWGAALFIALAGVSALLSPFSSAPLVPSAVVIWGADKTFILLFAGWLVGNTASYAIGYYLGYPVVSRIAPKRSLDKWVEILSNRVDLAVAFLFRLATPSETGYVFGTLKYNFFKYFFITFLAELPFVYITVYVGEAFVDLGWGAFAGLLALWVVVISLAIYLLNRRLNGKLK